MGLTCFLDGREKELYLFHDQKSTRVFWGIARLKNYYQIVITCISHPSPILTLTLRMSLRNFVKFDFASY